MTVSAAVFAGVSLKKVSLMNLLFTVTLLTSLGMSCTCQHWFLSPQLFYTVTLHDFLTSLTSLLLLSPCLPVWGRGGEEGVACSERLSALGWLVRRLPGKRPWNSVPRAGVSTASWVLAVTQSRIIGLWLFCRVALKNGQNYPGYKLQFTVDKRCSFLISFYRLFLIFFISIS